MNHKTRIEVYTKSDGCCEVIKYGTRCGSPAVDIHHIIAKGRGGTDDIGNLIAVCRLCHHEIHFVGGEWTKQYKRRFQKCG